jgi:hypothetical protein
MEGKMDEGGGKRGIRGEELKLTLGRVIRWEKIGLEMGKRKKERRAAKEGEEEAEVVFWEG